MATSTSPRSNQKKSKSNGAADPSGHETVVMRYEFYRDGFRILCIVSLLCLVVIGLLGSTVRVLVNRQPERTYFTVNQANQITKIVGLKEPYVTAAKLSSWAALRVTEAYQLDPVNLSQQVEKMREHYTPEGFESYKQSLVDSGTVDLMTRKVMIMSGQPAGVAIVVREGVENGIYTWYLRVPMLVGFKSANAQAQRKRMIDLTIVRRHTIETPAGIAITQFNARDL